MRKTTLLVVEDEPNLLMGIRDILELDGYEVNLARNGQQALEFLQQAGNKLPDLIVSDIMMPYMDGFELLQEVRKRENWLSIPFIFLTAKGEKADIQSGKMLGVDDYLVKPFDADDLLVAVEAKLRRHRALRDVQSSVVERIKRSILTILNHEFRTPLTLVVAYADMLKETDVESMNEDELLMFLREINTGADRLRRLIENFIMLVELETGDAKRTYEWRKQEITNLHVIVEEARRQVFQSELVNAACDLKLQEAHPPFIGDIQYLTVIIRELIDNAVKFSEPGQTISVETQIIDNDIYLSVIDQGRGITTEELEHIWESFYQINRDEYEDQGAGSGLTLVKGFASLLNARLDVNSDFGKGSRFTIILPVLNPAQA